MNRVTELHLAERIKTAVLIIPILAAIGIPLTANAAGTGSGTVTQVGAVTATGLAVIYTSTTVNEDLCGQAQASGRFVLNLSVTAGRTMYAQAVAALLSGATVEVIGAGTCNLDNTDEDIAWMNVY